MKIPLLVGGVFAALVNVSEPTLFAVQSEEGESESPPKQLHKSYAAPRTKSPTPGHTADSRRSLGRLRSRQSFAPHFSQRHLIVPTNVPAFPLMSDRHPACPLEASPHHRRPPWRQKSEACRLVS